MDPVLEAAARALARFDPLAALKVVALRQEPQALALRGIAMAQLGDYGASRKLLGLAARAFAHVNRWARARCLAALGEVALAARDLKEATRSLDLAMSELEAHGDRLNALFVRLQRVRCLILRGAIHEAADAHRAIDLAKTPPNLRTLSDLIGADIAIRNLEPRIARALLTRARHSARGAAIDALSHEVERALRELDAPVAQAVQAGAERMIRLDEVVEILGSGALVVDVCRRRICAGDVALSLLKRPVLLALAAQLAGAFPGEATRGALALAAFGAKRVTDSTRVRLRVEIGRLRRVIAKLAQIDSGEQGYVLRPRGDVLAVALLPPANGEASALLALLRGGESWSTSALATALGTSQRSVQRALTPLRDEGRVESIGAGRSQRWVAPPPEGFATTLLLVARRSEE